MHCDQELEASLRYLPPLCRQSVLKALETRRVDATEYLSEIRLRLGRRTAVCFGDVNILCEHISTYDDIGRTLREMCAGSVYAYQNTIREGYVPLDNGGRAGVVGDIRDSAMDIAIESIVAINIRIPHHKRGICSKVYNLFKENERGILIYSRPKVGKTTLLRDLAIELSRGKDAKNVALIDTRRELDNGQIPQDCLIDTYHGYPKRIGIEIAVRTMASDVIICDEVGREEIDAVRYTVLSSVPVIACVHAKNKYELMVRPDISTLLDMKAFGFIVGIEREAFSETFDFVIDEI